MINKISRIDLNDEVIDVEKNSYKFCMNISMKNGEIKNYEYLGTKRHYTQDSSDSVEYFREEARKVGISEDYVKALIPHAGPRSWDL